MGQTLLGENLELVLRGMPRGARSRDHVSRGGSSSRPLGGRGWRVTFLLGSRTSWSSAVSYRPPALLFSGIIAHLCFGLLAREVRVTPASRGFEQVLYEDPA